MVVTSAVTEQKWTGTNTYGGMIRRLLTYETVLIIY